MTKIFVDKETGKEYELVNVHNVGSDNESLTILAIPDSPARWRELVGFEGLYEVSDAGEIRRVDSGKLLKPDITYKGYAQVFPSADNTRSTKYVHRAVAEAFIPNPTNAPYVNHKDGNKLNNHVDNLEWCTPTENVSHAVRTGLQDNSGTKNGRSKLTDNQVDEIRQLKGLKTSYAVANNYGIGATAVQKIWNGQSYKRATGYYLQVKFAGANGITEEMDSVYDMFSNEFKNHEQAKAAAEAIRAVLEYLHSPLDKEPNKQSNTMYIALAEAHVKVQNDKENN